MRGAPWRKGTAQANKFAIVEIIKNEAVAASAWTLLSEKDAIVVVTSPANAVKVLRLIK